MEASLRITVLKDNAAARPDVYPGHGLALLIEHGGARVLLDTGPDDTVVANAQALGLNLAPLDAIVLSHGHYDHTGGLAAVLHEVGAVRVIAHPGAFDERYARESDGTARYIGMPLAQLEYEGLGAELELSAAPVRVSEAIFTTGQVPQSAAAAGPARLWRRDATGMSADDFRDDVSVVIQLAGCSAVITGCAHAGLLNILRHAQALLSGSAPRVAMGGLHLSGAPDPVVVELAQEAQRLGVCSLLPCHCTGERAVQTLTTQFAGTLLTVGTGSVVTVSANGTVTDVMPLAAMGAQTQQGM
jgi:7,8-dihydropterin-6-yl-methyl-4-(beta-D-ribofuranosyl)aminobenzene 5'-phosphate synthase